MQNNVSIFSFNHELEVRVILKQNEPWFCAPDVFRILGIVNGRNLLSKEDFREGVCHMYTPDKRGTEQKTNFINEPNLYRVIFRSDKKEARNFQKWLYEEVLPQIRKTGRYSKNNNDAIKDLVSGYKRLLVVMERGRITSIKDLEGMSVIDGDKLDTITTNMRLMGEQLNSALGYCGDESLLEELKPLH